MKKTSLLALIPILSFILISCDKDDPVPELDQEVITDVALTFTEVNEAGETTDTPMEYTASSDEGIELGGNVQIDAIDGLESGKTYLLEIKAFNGIANEDITVEIKEEGDEHQFFFIGSAFVGDTAMLTYTYDDADEDGRPIGLKGMVTVAESLESNTSEFRLVLRHDLEKEVAGAVNPSWIDYAQAGGESDLDITFPVIF